MSRRVATLMLMAVVGLTGACARQEPVDPAEEAWGELVERWNGLESAEEKTALAEEYLAEYPDTEHSGSMASVVVYYRGDQMNDPQGARDVVTAALERIRDPEQRFEVSMELLSLADSIEIGLDLAQVVNELAVLRPLTYSEHQQVFEIATDMEEWTIAAEHADAAVDLATPEVYRADYPDREFTDEDVAERVRRRKAEALAYGAWAAYNLGDPELAFARFAAADEVGSVNYFSVPTTPLFTFWGRAALSEGELDSAMELLGAEVAFGGEGSSAEPFLREAFIAKNGDEKDFDEFLWATRNELAPEVDDFTLLDYQGEEVSLGEVGAGKVTLLAFWFPT